MQILAQELIDKYKTKIKSSNHHPSDPIEALKARIVAALLLSSDRSNAERFIKKTSQDQEKSLAFLRQWSSEVKECQSIQICSTYQNIEGSFIEFKCYFSTWNEENKTLHLHTQYQIKDNRCYFIDQYQPMIRIIGDSVLHRPAIPFPQTPTPAELMELNRQIEIAKTILIKTGGAGIAANQCAYIEEPYCFTIVGVFYESKKHIEAVNQRYPNVRFPSARVMVNPHIIKYSSENQIFNHACLSVPCGNRCAVQSPKEIFIAFNDASESMALKQTTYLGIDAVVLWHELKHILDGKTYIDVMLGNLSIKDLILFKKVISKELYTRNSDNEINTPILTTPPFYLSVKMDYAGNSYLDLDELVKALPNVTEETLMGLLNRVYDTRFE